MREDKALNELLDMRDSAISAKYERDTKAAREAAEYSLEKRQQNKLRERDNGERKLIMEQITAMTDETPEIGEELKKEYPSLMDIIEDMNPPKYKHTEKAEVVHIIEKEEAPLIQEAPKPIVEKKIEKVEEAPVIVQKPKAEDSLDIMDIIDEMNNGS